MKALYDILTKPYIYLKNKIKNSDFNGRREKKNIC